MDLLRKIPLGQYVASESGWLRVIDPRIKFSWVLMFLVTPVLANPIWRVCLVLALLIITFFSFLPLRLWWRSICILGVLSILVGLLAMLLPTSEPNLSLPVRSPYELPQVIVDTSSWELFRVGPLNLGGISLGPLVVNLRSAELAIKTSTLTFTVIHSVNLMLITTPPEDIVWALRWFLSPLGLIGLPIDLYCFQLLLALRFLPLVQEELQNLFRSLVTRDVNFRRLGFKSSLGLLISVGERLMTNILLRAEQGADSLIARSGFLISPEKYRTAVKLNPMSSLINIGSLLLLFLILIGRGRYGNF